MNIFFFEVFLRHFFFLLENCVQIQVHFFLNSLLFCLTLSFLNSLYYYILDIKPLVDVQLTIPTVLWAHTSPC